LATRANACHIVARGKGKSELTATTNHQLAVKRPVQPFELQISIAFFGPSAGMSSARG
jgi:hypothetical protein